MRDEEWHTMLIAKWRAFNFEYASTPWYTACKQSTLKILRDAREPTPSREVAYKALRSLKVWKMGVAVPRHAIPPPRIRRWRMRIACSNRAAQHLSALCWYIACAMNFSHSRAPRTIFILLRQCTPQSFIITMIIIADSTRHEDWINLRIVFAPV